MPTSSTRRRGAALAVGVFATVAASALAVQPVEAKRVNEPITCKIDAAAIKTTAGPSKSREGWIEVIAVLSNTPATCGTKTVPVTGQVITELQFPALGGTATPNGILVVAVEHKIKANDDREMPVLRKTSGQARYRCTKSKCSLKGVAQKSGQSRTAFTAQFNPKEVGIDSFVFHNITWTAAATRDLDGQSAG